MPNISSYGPGVGLSWLKQGWRLFAKQFVRLSLLFMLVSMLMPMVTMLPFLGILLGILFIPLSQMLIFNAAYGIRLRGYFLLDDLTQKLRTPQVWGRLLIASFINLFITYFILNFTLPTIPVSADAIMNMQAEQAAEIIATTFSLENMVIPLFCVTVYLLLSFWVYPLICWEELRVSRAFSLSFKATMSNALALSMLFIIFVIVTISLLFLAKSLLLTLSSTVLSTISLFIFNTLLVGLYMSLFVAYMEIFYGRDRS